MQYQEQQVYYQNQENEHFSAEPKVMQQKQKYRDQTQKGSTSNKINLKQGKSKTESKHEVSQQGQVDENDEDNHYERLGGGNDDQADIELDFYLDQPPLAIYIPKQQGIEQSTQIEQGDLFDYDLEVEPLIEIIIGRVVENSRRELIEEEEQLQLQLARHQYNQVRNAELMKCQRMGRRQDRKDQERERRHKQYEQQIINKTKEQQLGLIQVVSKNRLDRAVGWQVDVLEQAGVLKDSLNRKLEGDYKDYLFTQVDSWLQQATGNRQVVDNCYVLLQNNHKAAHASSIQQENQRRAAIIQERENKAYLKQQKKALKQKKAEQLELQDKRKECLQQITIGLVSKRNNIEHQIVLEQNIIEVEKQSQIQANEKVIATLHSPLLQLALHLTIQQQTLGRTPSQDQITNILKAYLLRTKNPQVINIDDQQYLKTINQDIFYNEENQQEFMATRAETLSNYYDNLHLLHIINQDIMQQLSHVEGFKDIVDNLKKAMLEILFEQKQGKEDQNTSSSQSRIEKVKVKSQLILKGFPETEELPPVDILINLQPVREFKQEESIQDTSNNNLSQRDLNNKSVNKSINRSLNKSLQEKEKEKELERQREKEKEEQLLQEQLLLQQEQQAALLLQQQQQEEEERLRQAPPPHFTNNQQLLDYHLQQIHNQYQYAQNQRFTDIEYFDGSTYKKKCSNIPEQRLKDWQLSIYLLSQVNEKRVVMIDNRAHIVIQEQLGQLVNEFLGEVQPKEQLDMLEGYRTLYAKLYAEAVTRMAPQVIYDIEE